MNVMLALILGIASITGITGYQSLAFKDVHKVKIRGQACVKPDKDYSYKTCERIDVMADNIFYRIPVNFKTDLASIPKWYWSVISPAKSEFMRASIVHDYFYRCSSDFTRKQADELFYTLLRHDGASQYNSMKMYLAVRFFGEPNFQANPQRCH